MYAIIRSGSKQYRVEKGDVIHVDLLGLDNGQQVEFNEVLFLGSAEGVAKVGTPMISGTLVKGELLSTVKGPKIQSVKYKQRKHSKKKFGHRQKYSAVRITDIVG